MSKNVRYIIKHFYSEVQICVQNPYIDVSHLETLVGPLGPGPKPPELIFHKIPGIGRIWMLPECLRAGLRIQIRHSKSESKQK